MPDMAPGSWNPSIWKKQEDQELKASLYYLTVMKAAWEYMRLKGQDKTKIAQDLDWLHQRKTGGKWK